MTSFSAAITDALTIAGVDAAIVTAVGAKLDQADSAKQLEGSKSSIISAMGLSSNAVQLAQIAAIQAQDGNNDAFVRRSRPTFLYIMYGVVIAGALLAIFSAFNPGAASTITKTFDDFFRGLPDSLYWLFGSAYLGYSGARSFDKWQTGKQAMSVTGS